MAITLTKPHIYTAILSNNKIETVKAFNIETAYNYLQSKDSTLKLSDVKKVS